MFEGSTILITGGSGSWGQELVRKLLPRGPREIRVLSRSRSSQEQMRDAFDHHPVLRFLIGDVRDYAAVHEACRGADYVFHLAALKHVPICEWQPDEAMKTNIVGTENVVKASIAHRVRKVIDISTDKAADPVNFYGLTKAVGEHVMIAANRASRHTRFVCIRGGNVLGSNGSVVPFFMKQIAEGADVTVTSLAMTRFFLTIPEAIDLVLLAARETVGGETFVMRMNACRILDLVNVLIRRLADVPVGVREIGVRPGEKLHEVLVTSKESPRTRRYSDQYFVILPPHADPELERHYAGYAKVDFEAYGSDAGLMTDDEIEAMLVKGGFLP